MTVAAIRLEGVACARGGRMLFEGLDLALEPGGGVLVTGPNGAGKSSLIRIIAGLLKASVGRVSVTGERALLAEAAGLDPELPVSEALRFWAGLDGRRDAVADALEAVGLLHLYPVPVRMLSTGQRKRVGIARVVASGAPIWLLDEPANGLDHGAIGVLGGLIAAHRAAGGIAVVATHLPIRMQGAREIMIGGSA